MAKDRLVSVGISLTTLDKDLARRMEPRAAAPHRRIETIAALGAAGVPVAVLVSPIIPFLTESEIERILEAAAAAGAKAAATSCCACRSN
jgi:DNA repair photolyase